MRSCTHAPLLYGHIRFYIFRFSGEMLIFVGERWNTINPPISSMMKIPKKHYTASHGAAPPRDAAWVEFSPPPLLVSMHQESEPDTARLSFYY